MTNKLGFTELDFYAMRRAMSHMSIDGLEVSGAAQVIIDMLQKPDLQRSVADALMTNARLSGNILYIDPNKPFEPEKPVNEKLVWLHEVTEIRKPRYLIEEYPFYEKGFNMLIGRAGARKSLIAVDFLATAAMHNPDKNFLYIAGEGYTGLLARMKAWELSYDVSLRNAAVYNGGIQFKDALQVQMFEQLCRSVNIAFVVVDTLQTVTVGLDENSTKEMGIFCDMVRDMSAELGIGILFVHHLNKQDQYRGSSVLMASADSVLRSVVDDSGVVTLHNSLSKGGKNKDNAEAEPIHKRVQSVDVPVDDGVESIGVIVDAGDISEPNRKLKGNARHLLEIIDSYEEGLRVKDIVKATGISQSTVYYTIGNLKKHGFIDTNQDKYRITEKGRDAYA